MPLPSELAYGPELPSVQQLNYLAGDYWYRMFPRADQLDAINGAFRQQLRQMLREIDEVTLAASYSSATGYRVKTHWPLLVPLSSIRKSPVRYGQGYLYGEGDAYENIVYGQTDFGVWEVPVPFALVDYASVADGIVSPTHIFAEGSQSDIRDEGGIKWLSLPDNPADFAEHRELPSGEVGVILWLHMAKFDAEDVAAIYGDIMGTRLRTTEAYLAAMRAVFGAYTAGGNEIYLRQLLAAAVGQPVAEDRETVITVLTAEELPVVITNKRSVYGKPNDNPLVTGGQRLVAGDFFFDSVLFTDGRRDSRIWLDRIDIPPRFTGLAATISVEAGVFPVNGSGDSTYVDFSTAEQNQLLVNWFGDGDKLSLALRHYAAGYTGEPASTLMSTVNLIDFVAEQWLQHGVSVSRVRTASLERDGAELLKLWRELLPPWVSHIVQFDGDTPASWLEPDVCLVPPDTLNPPVLPPPPTTTTTTTSTTTAPPTTTTTTTTTTACSGSFTPGVITYQCVDGQWVVAYSNFGHIACPGTYTPPTVDCNPDTEYSDCVFADADCPPTTTTTSTTTTTPEPTTTTTTTTTPPPTTTTTTTTTPEPTTTTTTTTTTPEPTTTTTTTTTTPPPTTTTTTTTTTSGTDQGACCHDGSCSITDQSYCEGFLFGDWQGAGSGCDPSPCVQSPPPP